MEKKKRFELRLTEKEKEVLKTKAKNYISMSALVIDAVQNFNEKGGANKIESLNSWAKDFKKYNVEINRIGNNLNQIAHHFNILKIENRQLSDEIISETNQKIEEWNLLFKEMVELQRNYTNNVINI